MSADPEQLSHRSSVTWLKTGWVQRILLATGAALASGGLTRIPEFRFNVLAGGAARIAALLSGSPLIPSDENFALSISNLPVAVTNACSGADFYWITTALLAWHFAPSGRPRWQCLAGALTTGLIFAIGINALRIVAVAQAHRWIIPRFPPAYGAFLHLMIGAAVFLPALVGLNLLFECYERRNTFSR